MPHWWMSGVFQLVAKCSSARAVGGKADGPPTLRLRRCAQARMADDELQRCIDRPTPCL